MVLWYAHMVSLISSQYCRGTRGGALSGFSMVGMKWQARSVKPEVVWKRSLYSSTSARMSVFRHPGS